MDIFADRRGMRTAKSLNMLESPTAKCCHCGQIRSGSVWQPEQNPPNSLVRYSHTYCPVCLQKVLMELDSLGDDFGLEIRKAS